MDLRDYPRPMNDTGIGIHWSAGYAAAVGSGQIRDFWLPELIAMGVKWVKIANHDGALGLVELLLKHDLMPIVRIYRPQPNPGVLDTKSLAAVRDCVAAGVHYLEFNNEPDIGVEWQSRQVPPDAPRIVAQNAIVDIEAILGLGGYPAVPALAPGTKWDLVGEICRLGRRDLFSEPVWQAIHNYSLNHPLDYPYDAGNQQGAPYTADFYDRLAAEKWEGDAWQGWDLGRVNDERRRNANPGITASEDPSCWRSYEYHDQLIRDQIGRSLPILATENGFIVGERPDPRYPATTPQLHMAQTLEACRIMMGVSSRFDHAPDYYFCTAFWLLANYNLRSWAPEWEGQAWYSHRWPDGKLPTIDALKAEPKQARRWRGETGIGGRISGVVRKGPGLAIRAVRGDGWPLAGQVGADEYYEFTDVPPGRYRVILPDAGMEQEVVLTPDRSAAEANFDLTSVVVITSDSVVHGTVRGGAGRKVLLSRPSDRWVREQVVAADGTYRFTALAAGTYTIAVAGTNVQAEGISLDGRNQAVVNLVTPGWSWEVGNGGPGPGFGVVRCRVTERADIAVRLWTVGWEGITRRTGSKPEFGADVCEFAPLGSGKYNAQPEGIELVAEVNVDGRHVHWLTFTEVSEKGGSARVGAVAGTLRGHQEDAAPDSNHAVATGRSSSAADAAGEPQADLTPPFMAHGSLRPAVEEGGPGPGFCVVRCRVVGQPGRAVSLWMRGWGGITQVTGSKPEYGSDACEFAPLAPGTYFVEMEERDTTGAAHTVRTEVELKPNQVIWVRFEGVGEVQPPEAGWKGGPY